MTKIYLRKIGGMLCPADDDAAEQLRKYKAGTILYAEVASPRNYKFTKKYFALLKFAFDAWEPATVDAKNRHVIKNFDRFRKDVAISTGFYELVVNINGDTRAEAKSISFARMDNEEFEKLYQATITLFLEKFQLFGAHMTREQVESTVNTLLEFAT